MNDQHPIIRKDWLIAASFGLAAFIGLFIDLNGPGVTWDEAAPNFVCAKNQAYWISHLFELERPFSKETIDRYWETRSDHPSLPRTVAALSYLLFSPLMDEITALRIPSALMFSVLAASIFVFLRVFMSRIPALAGGLAIALMPRLFGHAHVFSLDVPIMCWWFWAAMVGYLVINGYAYSWLFGLVYAIAFTTKLHSVFLPFPLLLWALIYIGWVKQWNKSMLKRLLIAAGWAIVLTPVIYVGLQPWLWHDTIPRIMERFLDLAEKTTIRPIPLFYFNTYFANNTPWHYPLVMLGLTVPISILVLMLVAILFPTQWQGLHNNGSTIKDKLGLYLFFMLHFITPILIILLPLAQGYDGCRLFLPCFPFAACLAGFGFDIVLRYLSRFQRKNILTAIMMAVLILPSLWTYISLRPYCLAYYNALAGGISGAEELGMETTYWCDALTGDFLKQTNEIIPPGKTVKPASMSFAVYEYYLERGWIDAAIDDPADYTLLQFRQGMFRQDEWYLVRYKKPVLSIEVDGIPLYALYKN